jgi:hypothetical protein
MIRTFDYVSLLGQRNLGIRIRICFFLDRQTNGKLTLKFRKGEFKRLSMYGLIPTTGGKPMLAGLTIAVKFSAITLARPGPSRALRRLIQVRASLR